MSENLRSKTPEELENQANRVAEDLGEEVVQPSTDGEVFNMSLEEIKEKFPLRYEMYLKTIRGNKNENAELSEEERNEMSKQLAVLNNLDKYIENHWVNGERTLRERQINVFEDMRDFLEKGGRDGYIKLPTGAGKTVIFSEFIEAIGLKTLIVVPTKILVRQTEEKLSEFAGDLDVGKIYSDAKKHGDDVTIITYQSLVQKLEEGLISPEDYKCLILDEAHASLSDKRVDAVNQFGHAIRMGFTATPEYSKNKNVSQILSTEIHSLDVKEAAEEGVISPFSVILAETDIDISNIQIKANGEYDKGDLERAINVAGRNNSAVELYEKMFNGQLGVAYCTGIDHAKTLAKLFIKKGIKAAVVSGKQSQKKQDKIISQFESGEIMVLCNADILIAGFDEPKASVCLNLRPTLSPVVAEQRGGRVLRLDPENPNKHANIIDFVDKNSNKKSNPITFADIANASVVLRAKEFGGGRENINSGGEARPNIEIEGLRVITDPQEVMRVVAQRQEEKSEKAPEGWLTPGAILRSKKTGKGQASIKEISDRYRKSNPEWFRAYLSENGNIHEHFAPELVDIILSETKSHEQAPEGWMVMFDLMKKTEKADTVIKKITNKYREFNPDWFHPYLNKAGRMHEHFAPELVDIILSETKSHEQAPEGWKTVRGLNEEKGYGRKSIKKIIDRYRESNQDWFHPYFNRSGRVNEHFSPELVAIVKKELKNKK